jgi:carboxyl-terminal processing protease
VVSIISRAHEERVAHNPDFVALQGDVDALTQLRSQRDVSLNLDKRRAERDAVDAERLKRENARRVARGLAPLADVAALDDAEAPDAVLDEAMEIAADAVQLPKAQEPARFS